ncbi:MAG: phospholipid carrier-dependent glycosyltransferase [Defluviitaleaceae bacterium]|nr:phospholipid carrier-dependent glycosyltransferase [Defluviitaleaceae bacterium]
MQSQFPRHATFIAMLTAALIVRLVFAVSGLAFQIDLNTFKFWADHVFSVGMANFYTYDFFTDYPPGYMYVLFVIGWLRSALGIEHGTNVHVLMMMTPAILADLTTGFVIYSAALRKLPDHALPIAAAYLFNPVIILDSAVWGQVDSVFVLPIIISLLMLTERRYLPAYLLYAAAILIKPQSLIMAPVYLYSFWVVIRDYGARDGLAKLARWGGACAAFALAVMLPFTQNFNILPILAQYADTMTQYSFASLNAYNFHALAGAMWQPQDTLFLGVPLYVIGYASIVIITFLSLYLLRRDDCRPNVFYVAALLSSFVFVFSVRMHERYLYPAVPLLLLVYVFRPDRRILALFAGFSLTFTVNVIDALRMLNHDVSLEFLVNERWVSALNVALVCVMVFFAFKLFGSGYTPAPAPKKEHAVREDKLAHYFEKYEWHLLAALVIVYAVIAFVRLGDLHAPQSFWDQRIHREEQDWFTGWHPRLHMNEVIDMGVSTHINELRVYLGPRHDQSFSLYLSDDTHEWELYRNFDLPSVFFWHDFDVNFRARYLRIQPTSSDLMIGELGLLQFGQVITPAQIIIHPEGFYRNVQDLGGGAASVAAHPLFDEQHIVPAYSHFMNSTYFDEIYHPRTAYEFIRGMFVYETTHPPLGKVIKSWGIRVFGMTPFGWRFAGTFVGVLMIIPLYFLARELFDGGKPFAFVAAGLFAFDFMHFAQTRLATIDTYVTFFVILMYLFMYMYYKSSLIESDFRKDMLWLFLSGLSMGLGIASKWQGVYAVAGLALLWLIVMIRRAFEFRQALTELPTSGTSLPEKVRSYPRDTLAMIGMCVVFFVIIPVAVYALSYVYFVRTPWMDGISSIIENQVHMFTYHAGIDQPHPFSAQWWEWPLNTRPMFMYMRWITHDLAEGISSFGNPVVWWGGLVGMVYAICRLFDTRRPRWAALFIVVAFASQFVPWIFVPRTTYIYHYFPSVPFITLALVYAIREELDLRRPYTKYAALGAAVFLFALFYPVLSGLAVPTWYVDTFLRWISTWRLI